MAALKLSDARTGRLRDEVCAAAVSLVRVLDLGLDDLDADEAVLARLERLVETVNTYLKGQS